MGSFYDFSPRCVHAVRVEGPLRRCHHDIFVGPPLRPDRPQRRRQVDLHEAADRRTAAAARHRGPSRQGRRAPPGPVRLRRVPRHRHGDHGQPQAVERAAGARAALREERPHRRRRHASGRARRHRRRRGRLRGGGQRRHPAPGARHPRGAAPQDDVGDAGRAESSRAAGAGAVRQARGAAARRADQPPRPRLDSLGAGISAPLRRHADRDFARSALPERRLHPHRRHRLSDDHHLHRRLRRDGARQDPDPLARGGGQRAAREEDLAAAGLHRPLLRRHPRQPGDVAQEGSRAAPDHGTGALQHPAPLHQVRDEPAVGPRRRRDQGRQQGVRRPEGRRTTSARS